MIDTRTTPDAEELRLRLRAMAQPTSPVEIAAVASLLAHPSPVVCELAVDLLVRGGSAAAADAAAAHLDGAEPRERGYAFAVLARLGSAAMPALRALLRSPDVDLRKFAVDALARTGARQVVDDLIAALDDPDINVAGGAAEALAVPGLDEAVAPLAAALGRGPDWLRFAALRALGTIGGQPALAAIVTTPPDVADFVALAAIAALGAAGRADPPAAASVLAGLLDRDDPLVRDAVLPALAALVDDLEPGTLSPGACRRIADAASSALAAPQPAVRRAAVRCLAAFGALPPAALARQLQPLLDADADAAVQDAALAALVAVDALAAGDLVALAVDAGRADPLRSAALGRVHSSGDPARDALLTGRLARLAADDPQPAIRAAAIVALLRLDPAGGAALAVAVFAEDEPAALERLLDALLAEPAVAALPVVTHALDHAEGSVRRAVAGELLPRARAAAIAARDELATLVARMWADTDPGVRGHALALAGVLDDGAARTILREALAHPDHRLRVRAIDALGPEADAAALDEVAGCLADPHPLARAAALRKAAQLGRLAPAQTATALDDEHPLVRRAAVLAIAVLMVRGGPPLAPGIAERALDAARAAEDDAELVAAAARIAEALR